MALDRVGTPYGVRTSFSWQDWTLHARVLNNAQIITNMIRLNIGDDDPDIIAVRAIHDVRQQGDAIAALLQTRTT